MARIILAAPRPCPVCGEPATGVVQDFPVVPERSAWARPDFRPPYIEHADGEQCLATPGQVAAFGAIIVEY